MVDLIVCTIEPVDSRLSWQLSEYISMKHVDGVDNVKNLFRDRKNFSQSITYLGQLSVCLRLTGLSHQIAM